MRPRRSKRIYIFEGPDGAGKTTAALKLAEAMDAQYVHLGPFTGAKHINTWFAQAMMPAVLGHSHVVMDRCWLSDPIYGRAFRKGLDRVGKANQRMLERLALRCGAVVVRSLPPVEVVLENYRKRKELEMLENEDQLRQVYQGYMAIETSLPIVNHDYTQGPVDNFTLTGLSSFPHPMALASAGVWNAPVALVGEEFAETRDGDPLYQWPFASFNGQGCSRWLTEHLEKAGVPEHKLFWINADQDLEKLFHHAGNTFKYIVALGIEARDRLGGLGIEHQQLEHPQAWRRFNAKDEYPLGALLQEALK